MITGYRCAVCGTHVPIGTPWPWRCPKATNADRHHVLRIEGSSPAPADEHPNPFVAYRRRMAWYWFALAHGFDDGAAVALVEEVDAAVRAVDGTGFAVTPCGPADRLSAQLDLDVWVKDETANVAGSHKGRHVVTILLHLLAAERAGVVPAAVRPRLAIASCGNAALAAATLAAAVGWPIDVFVPPDADAAIVERLEALGAGIVVCPRHAADPPGDPCVHRFRVAVDEGAVPFSVQGPENSLCLDGGRTIGWELAAALGATTGRGRVFVQVGGGALVTGVGDGLREAGVSLRVHAVQAEGCAPLAPAWECAQRVGRAEAGQHWSECMRPWPATPASAATGILDDETYDWLGAVDAMAASGGAPVVAAEADVVAALDLARRTTSIPVDATGTAGLAGLRAFRRHVRDGERVVLLFTGRSRSR